MIVVVSVLQPSILYGAGISIHVPDIVAVIVAAQAFTRSYALSGSIAVFGGLIVDLVSPGTGLIGVSSIAYLVLAVVIHTSVQAPHRSPWIAVSTAAAAPAFAVLIRGVILFTTNQSDAIGNLPIQIFAQLLFGVVFALFLVPIIDLIDRPLYRDSLPLRIN